MIDRVRPQREQMAVTRKLAAFCRPMAAMAVGKRAAVTDWVKPLSRMRVPNGNDQARQR
jgi:hypothetical protein